MTDEDQAYNLAAIRMLLLAAFTAEDLRRFCHDRPLLRPIVTQFGPGEGLDDMVDEVITHVEKHDLFAPLLVAVKEENPNQYAGFEPQLLAAAAPKSVAGPRAIADLTQAVTLNHYDAPAYKHRALARETQGDWAGAMSPALGDRPASPSPCSGCFRPWRRSRLVAIWPLQGRPQSPTLITYSGDDRALACRLYYSLAGNGITKDWVVWSGDRRQGGEGDDTTQIGAAR
jgi:hypothetical protein